jgi:hypothetical protein
MENLRTYEEYRFFKGRKTIPGYDWNKGEFSDVPNVKDEKEPFLNKNKPDYWNKKNRDSALRKQQWDIDRAKYQEERKQKIAKSQELLSTGIFNVENVAEVREMQGFYMSENDYYKFILKDGRKFKLHMSYSKYETTGERADFEGAYLTEYNDKGKAIREWTIYDEKPAEELADVLKSKLGKYTDKWEFGKDEDDDVDDGGY